ncbi:hypothetical protein ACVIHH_000899 [Bradyrhizobium sp. USDA 4518]
MPAAGSRSVSVASVSRHHHVEAERDDRLDDLLIAEMLAHRGKGRIADADLLDHLAAEAKQRTLGCVECSIVVFAALDGIDLRLGDADTERDRHMLPPFIGAALELRGLQDQELAVDRRQLLLVQDRIGEPHRRDHIGLGMGHHAEDVELDRHAVE